MERLPRPLRWFVRLLSGIGLIQTFVWLVSLSIGTLAAGFSDFPDGFRVVLLVAVAGAVGTGSMLALRHVPALASLGQVERALETGEPASLLQPLRLVRGEVRSMTATIRNTQRDGHYPFAFSFPNAVWAMYAQDLSREPGMGDTYDALEAAYREAEQVNARVKPRLMFTQDEQVYDDDGLDQLLIVLANAEEALYREISELRN